MRAISLWQPWASLVALGIKKYETRSWAPGQNVIGEPLLIHAAKRKLTLDEREWLEGLVDGYPELNIPHFSDVDYPRGVIVGKVNLSGFFKTELADVLSYFELDVGNYEPGRYAWMLKDAVKLEPIPFKGSQGFFNVPDELVREAN